MSRWDGVFRCEKLGVDDCVVWWDALAAGGAWAAVAVAVAAIVVAWIGIGVAAASTVFIWRLGVEANRASELAVTIAKREAKRQRDRDRKERILVLLQMHGEVYENKTKSINLLSALEAPDASRRFIFNASYRNEVVDSLAKISFPTADALVDRLHYLGKTEGPALARSVGMIRSLNREYIHGVVPLDEQNLVLNYGAICLALKAMNADLEVINVACKKEIIASGIDDAIAASFAARSNDGSQEG